MLQETSGFVKSYDGQTKWMHCFIEGDDLLDKYTIWNKVSFDNKIEFDSQLFYNKNFFQTKMKFYGEEVTDF